MALNTEVHEPSAKYLLARDGYLQTDIGLIPQEWSVKELRQIGNLSKGRGLLKEDIETSGAVPAIPYTALYTDFSEVVDYGRIKWFVDDIAGTIVVNEPCLLIASSSNMAANTGKASAIPGTTPVAIGREVIIFRTDHSAVFFSYLLSTAPYRKRTLVLARGTTIKHLYPATFANYRVAVPQPAEQLAITEALGNVDALLTGLERLIAKKRDIKQAAMQQLLTGQTRLPGFSGEWATKLLGELAEFYKGKGLPKSALSLHGSEPCIHYGELFTQYSERIEKTISFTNLCIGTFRSRSNDVLMPTSDVTPRGLAKASCVLLDDVVLGGDILVIRTNPAEISGVFLSYVIRQQELQVLSLVTGSTVFHLYGSDMRRFGFTAPTSLKEQNAIATVLSDMDAELSALEARLTKTRAIKQGMMQELLTGRTRLKC